LVDVEVVDLDDLVVGCEFVIVFGGDGMILCGVEIVWGI